MARFDHIEAHVGDIERYCRFLQSIFEGGKYEVISKTGTSMFTSPDGISIEVKKKDKAHQPVMSGFCNPCLRRPDPRELLERLELPIEKELDSPTGKVYFFIDHEGVVWHMKDLPE